MSTVDFDVQAFVSLFVLLSPITVAPIYTAMTRNLDASRARSTAIRAVFAAMIVLVVMSGAGEPIFRLFSISTDSLRVVGGVIFFLMATTCSKPGHPGPSTATSRLRSSGLIEMAFAVEFFFAGLGPIVRRMLAV